MNISSFLLREQQVRGQSDKKELIKEMTDDLTSNQLTATITRIRPIYFEYELADFLFGNKIPSEASIEFKFLVLANKYQGNIVRKIMIKEGITDYQLRKFVAKYALNELSPGMYVYPNKPIDSQFLFQQQYSKAVISHESALYCLDLTDVIPKQTVVSFPKSYNFNQILTEKNQDNLLNYLENETFRLVKNEEIGEKQRIQKQTSFGNVITVTSPERTIADILKPAHKTEEEIKVVAIQRFLKENPESKMRLRRVADSQRVLRELDHYLYALKL